MYSPIRAAPAILAHTAPARSRPEDRTRSLTTSACFSSNPPRAAASPIFIEMPPPGRSCPSSFDPRPPHNRVGRLEDVHPLSIAPRDLADRGLARNPSLLPVSQRAPEARPAHREADEPRHGRRGLQPLADLRVILAAAEDDAADVVSPAAAAPRRRPSDNPQPGRSPRSSRRPARRPHLAAP